MNSVSPPISSAAPRRRIADPVLSSADAVAPVRFHAWSAQGQTFNVAYQTFGSGPSVLFLPAISTVSTRKEWAAVAAALADACTVTLVDWPGFGGSSRPRAIYSPALYHAFLRDFVQRQFGGKVAVVAAGHATGYVLRLADESDPLWSCAVLAAPTWRGPLPTAMGERPRLYAWLRRMVAAPGLGHALYRLNTSRRFLRRMYGRHVYADQTRLTADFLREKQGVARQPGARIAAAAFVTGALDPYPDRRACVTALQGAPFPVLLVVGQHTPPKSRAEMAALAGARPRPPLVVSGSLALHEECADLLVPPLRQFLSDEA